MLAIYMAVSVGAPLATLIGSLHPEHTLIVVREGGHIDYVLVHTTVPANPESHAPGEEHRNHPRGTHDHGNHVAHTPELGTANRATLGKTLIPPPSESPEMGLMAFRCLDLDRQENSELSRIFQPPRAALAHDRSRTIVLLI